MWWSHHSVIITLFSVALVVITLASLFATILVTVDILVAAHAHLVTVVIITLHLGVLLLDPLNPGGQLVLVGGGDDLRAIVIWKFPPNVLILSSKALKPRLAKSGHQTSLAWSIS